MDHSTWNPFQFVHLFCIVQKLRQHIFTPNFLRQNFFTPIILCQKYFLRQKSQFQYFRYNWKLQFGTHFWVFWTVQPFLDRWVQSNNIYKLSWNNSVRPNIYFWWKNLNWFVTKIRFSTKIRPLTGKVCPYFQYFL